MKGTGGTMMIDLSRPIRSERIRAGFQPHWRTVFIYRCLSCGAERRILDNGDGRIPTIGGIRCECEGKGD